MSVDLVIHPAATRHQFRAQVCRLVERLIAMLDEIDGDADLEGGADDEPRLSFTGHMNQDMAIRGEPIGWAVERGEYDLEEACEDEGAEHDGREPEEDNDTSDYEASLCGVSFGVGSCSALDAEGTSAAFALDQSQGV